MTELRKLFEPFGEIIDIDIKKQGVVSAYSFVQYADIRSVVAALDKMDGQHIGSNRIKVRPLSLKDSNHDCRNLFKCIYLSG